MLVLLIIGFIALKLFILIPCGILIRSVPTLFDWKYLYPSQKFLSVFGTIAGGIWLIIGVLIIFG